MSRLRNVLRRFASRYRGRSRSTMSATAASNAHGLWGVTAADTLMDT